jgi:hypothetical protein
MTGYIMDWIDRTAAPNDYGYRFHKWNRQATRLPWCRMAAFRIPTIGRPLADHDDADRRSSFRSGRRSEKPCVEDEEYRLGSNRLLGLR